MRSEFKPIVERTLCSILGADKAPSALISDDLISGGHLDSYSILELTAQLEVGCDIVIPSTRIGGLDYRTIDSLTAMCADLATT